MSDALLTVANDLYSLVNALDPLPSPGSSAAAQLDARCKELLAHVQRLRDEFAAKRGRMAAQLERVAGNLRALSQSLPHRPDLTRLREARSRLMDSYESFVASMRQSLETSEAVPASLRPRNYARSLFHVANAVVGVALYQWVWGRAGCLIALGSILTVYATLDITRRIWPRWNEILFDTVFKRITRPRERHQVPAATWYAAATFIVTLLGSQVTAQVAVLVLGVGDPAASLIGRRYGKRKLWRRKSIVGTAAFVGVSLLAVSLFLWALKPMGLGAILLTAGVAALAGAMAELFSDDRLDDNFTVPLAVAAAIGLFL